MQRNAVSLETQHTRCGRRSRCSWCAHRFVLLGCIRLWIRFVHRSREASRAGTKTAKPIPRPCGLICSFAAEETRILNDDHRDGSNLPTSLRSPNRFNDQREHVRELVEAAFEGSQLQGYHCTRLTDFEAEEIVANGMTLPNLAIFERRIRRLQTGGIIKASVADRLAGENQAHESNREGRIWFIYDSTIARTIRGRRFFASRSPYRRCKFVKFIRNPHTRRAYAGACQQFFAWCEHRGLTLTAIRPFNVAAWVEQLQQAHSGPSMKQQLAAVRMPRRSATLTSTSAR